MVRRILVWGILVWLEFIIVLGGSVDDKGLGVEIINKIDYIVYYFIVGLVLC